MLNVAGTLCFSLSLLALSCCAQDGAPAASQKAAYKTQMTSLFNRAVEECKNGRPESAASYVLLWSRLNVAINSSPRPDESLYKADHYAIMTEVFAGGTKPCSDLTRNLAVLAIRFSQSAIDSLDASPSSPARKSGAYHALYKQMAYAAKLGHMPAEMIALFELRSDQYAQS